ncbi:TPA: phage repressor protein [Staphylococcus aureus]|uniref:Prophage antirepressor n=2 Tax=Phietavirus TaxID=1623298 RepID=W5R8M8_9CAUD|nr:phage repressor protein [Staphylococcus aureus]YP_008059031.1 anti-repressor [Staphylococcus phage StauST398-1]YP_009002831.1 anti-repressor [Staphylococcus phage StauST398-5]AFN39927.1 putative prophage antirepressor [Staphylococcus phage StauST398-1]AGR46297.1 prophage antirepressor [Staphylococcus phage StauST398-5]EJN0081122.1 phage repressor protein [Staphylococcus aureus]ELU3747362.1 phage repressor protein [Staphylococcus aureus]EPZ10058.1 BRO-like protein [Staphylococcus aureus S1
MQELQTFNFEELPVRTLEVDGEPYFIGKDVADILGYANGRDALSKHVDAEDKLTSQIATAGQNRNVTIINESGLYSLIFSSKLENAKRFKRWVTSEVLPTLRKTGAYQIPSDPMQALRLMFEATEQTKQEIKNVKDDVIDLKENQKLDAGDYNFLTRTINQRVAHIQRLHAITNQKQRSELFRDINSEVKKMTGASSRTNVRQKHFDDVIEMIANWFPSQATLYRIKQIEMKF